MFGCTANTPNILADGSVLSVSCCRGFTKIDKKDFPRFRAENRLINDGVSVKVSFWRIVESLAQCLGFVSEACVWIA